MGKNLIQQRRGRGTPVFRSPPQAGLGRAAHRALDEKEKFVCTGTVVDIAHSSMHSAPLAFVKYSDGEVVKMVAPDGIKVGDNVNSGASAAAEKGNSLPLRNIPDGTQIYNIEANPGDGGKFVRASGTFAKVISKTDKVVIVELPSKKQKEFQLECRATIGIIAGGGRLDKPLIKAGTAFFKMRSRNRFWPVVCGQSMNAVAHPHGGKRSSKKNYPFSVSRNTPPGAKVGSIASRRTGRRKK